MYLLCFLDVVGDVHCRFQEALGGYSELRPGELEFYLIEPGVLAHLHAIAPRVVYQGGWGERNPWLSGWVNLQSGIPFVQCRNRAPGKSLGMSSESPRENIVG